MGALFAGLVSRLKTFWPMLAGIVCARTALIAACYGSRSEEHTSELQSLSC